MGCSGTEETRPGMRWEIPRKKGKSSAPNKLDTEKKKTFGTQEKKGGNFFKHRERRIRTGRGLVRRKIGKAWGD